MTNQELLTNLDVENFSKQVNYDALNSASPEQKNILRREIGTFLGSQALEKKQKNENDLFLGEKTGNSFPSIHEEGNNLVWGLRELEGAESLTLESFWLSQRQKFFEGPELEERRRLETTPRVIRELEPKKVNTAKQIRYKPSQRRSTNKNRNSPRTALTQTQEVNFACIFQTQYRDKESVLDQIRSIYDRELVKIEPTLREISIFCGEVCYLIFYCFSKKNDPFLTRKLSISLLENVPAINGVEPCQYLEETGKKQRRLRSLRGAISKLSKKIDIQSPDVIIDYLFAESEKDLEKAYQLSKLNISKDSFDAKNAIR